MLGSAPGNGDPAMSRTRSPSSHGAWSGQRGRRAPGSVVRAGLEARAGRGTGGRCLSQPRGASEPPRRRGTETPLAETSGSALGGGWETLVGGKGAEVAHLHTQSCLCLCLPFSFLKELLNSKVAVCS